MLAFNYLIIVTTFLFIVHVHTYKILGIFPLAFKSHTIFYQAIMKSLARNGHQVDVISYYEVRNPPKNYRDIIDLSNSSYIFSRSQFTSIKEGILYNENFVVVSRDNYGLPVCKLISHEKIQNFIQDLPNNSPYDAVITEGLLTPCYFGFGFLLKVPVISTSSSFEFTPIARQMGNPTCMSFIPTMLIANLDIKTFWNRIKNTVITHIFEYLFYYISENQSEFMREYLDPNIPPVREVEKTVALSILNTHHSLRGAKPITTSVIEVAGIHVEEDDSVLTAELKQWMDESIHGVVYMSFGTTVPLESLPKETILSIYSSFAKLAPIRILMKVTRDNLPSGLPENVITMEWIPQIAVLKHPNTRLFISHCGIHSLIEALYFAIPVIGIPLFFDQQQNVRLLVKKNMCIELDHEQITESYMDAALSKVLNDPRIREAAIYHSKVFRDRPKSAGDEATYWIEYVIRNGAESIRSPAVHMEWWQAEILDIYVFLLLCTIMISYLITIIVKAILKK